MTRDERLSRCDALADVSEVAVPAEDIERKFRGAWGVFAATFGAYLAQEPSFQMWFGHYVISQFGIDRVAREPIVHTKPFPPGSWRARLGVQEARLDLVVSRAPCIRAVHYANRHYKSADGTGLSALTDLAVISELKVAATQWEGLGHAEVVLDAVKLTVSLREFERVHPHVAPPLAYLCVLDNHPKRTYKTEVLEERLHADPEVERSRFELLVAEASPRPALEATMSSG
jgi:hypothetical protein